MDTAQILVVDDDQNIRSILTHFFIQEGYDVLEADNGLTALDILKTKKIDLVISDIMMPELNGYELRRRLLEEEEWSGFSIPFIFMTTRSEFMDKLQSLNMGVDEYITKPFDKEELLARVKNILLRKEKLDRALEREKLKIMKEVVEEVSQDINNPLTVVEGYLKHLMSETEGLKPTAKKYLEQAVAGVNKIKSLMGELENFVTKKNILGK